MDCIRNMYDCKYHRLINDISMEELNYIVEHIDNVILIDIRDQEEFVTWHLQEAINIPLHELDQVVSKIIQDKNATIIVYCSSGMKSATAVYILDRLGYKNLYHLEGGLEKV